MAEKIKVKLLRPLNGEPEGSFKEYDERDAVRLEARGCVEIIDVAKPAAAKTARAKVKAD